MLRVRKGTCSLCCSDDRIVKYHPRLGKLCVKCNDKRLKDDRIDKYSRSNDGVEGETFASTRAISSTVNSKPKNSGEKELFGKLWDARKHVSYVSNIYLGLEAKAWYFSHVLPKSTYPKFRLNPDNIVFMTLDEHQLWDQGSKKILQSMPKWNRVFELEEKLKKEYAALYGRS